MRVSGNGGKFVRSVGGRGVEMLFNLDTLDLLGLLLAAIFGFTVGGLRRRQMKQNAGADQELRRAQAIVRDFERIAMHLRQAVNQHQRSVVKFKERLNGAVGGRRDTDWDDLSAETERILQPTLALADEVARAYDQIRHQSSLLLNMHESRIDPLTGIGNRRILNEMLASLYSLFSRYGTEFSLAILDIDNFKEINDSKGHLVGDQALANMASMLTRLARDTDTVTRYGGEEFVVVMPETDIDGAAEFAERVRLAIQYEMPFTVSIGLASGGDAKEPKELIDSADRALYQAKKTGKNRVFVSDPDGIRRVEDDRGHSNADESSSETVTA